jgi:hypothetical protein
MSNTYSSVGFANKYLKRDFISPLMLSKHQCDFFRSHFQYQRRVMEELCDTVPSKDKLEWCKENNHVVAPGPAFNTNLFGVIGFDCRLFSFIRDWWYVDEKQKFTLTDLVSGGKWLTLRKGAFPNSRAKIWPEQQKLVVFPEYIPNATEASYVLAMFSKIYDISLLPDTWVTTSSVNAMGAPVAVGRQDLGSLDIRSFWTNYPGALTGITSSLRL